MKLNEKELHVKAIMENVFVPVLHEIVSTANPVAYQRWNGNACRQTAIFGTKMLQSFLPEYQWTAWDGDFTDIVQGEKVKYNHAWIHGVNKAEGKGLLVDLSRNYHERLFIPVTSNKYPRNHPSYKHMKLIKKVKMDVEQKMTQAEFYTNKPSDQVLSDIYLKMQKILFTK